jgi:glucose/arabinose dehydrogenase
MDRRSALTRPSRRLLAAGAVTCLALAGCAFGQPDESEQGKPPNLPPPPSPSVTSSGQVGVQVLAKNLEAPWGLTFLPDASALVTERDTRRILSVSPGGVVKPVQTIAEAFSEGEGGLMGIVASPAYEADKTVFIYYTTKADNRIASLVLGQKPKPIVTGIPVSGIHNGGRLAFGPDGFLYAGTGDASQRGHSQDLKNLGGKILRMTPAGAPAPGNPFPSSLVYSFGHRNVQGLAWDAQKRLYATEFGQNRFDEVNLIQPGKNYGWPTVEGMGTDPRFVNPLAVWAPLEASPSGAAIVGDALIVACLKGRRLYVAELDGKGGITGTPSEALRDEYGRLRHVAAAPDGSIWALTSNRDGRGSPVPGDDRILRILPPSAGASVL